ncbi:MAG: hypothetical protein IPN69_02420 [Acidobacteria bacterium]|nr:hypothetical protein [Acidobacteriota bacterium]
MSGALVAQTYPSGRKVEFDYNRDGDISSIWGTTAAGQNRLYLNGITYNAAGQMTRLRLGNGKWESSHFGFAILDLRFVRIA